MSDYTHAIARLSSDNNEMKLYFNELTDRINNIEANLVEIRQMIASCKKTNSLKDLIK